MSFRIKVIQRLLAINERLLFYPKLYKYYAKKIKAEEPVIFDIGANKGQSISFFLKLFPKATIEAFEPNKRLFDFLSKKFSSDKVRINNCGVSDINGMLTLKETVTDETSTFSELNYNSSYLKMKSRILGVKPEDIVAKSYKVNVITLSSFIHSEKIRKIDILKIDTEGYELNCLKGLFNNCSIDIQIIQLEHHFDDMYANAVNTKDIEAYLFENDFVIDRKIKHGFGDFEEWLFVPKPNQNP